MAICADTKTTWAQRRSIRQRLQSACAAFESTSYQQPVFAAAVDFGVAACFQRDQGIIGLAQALIDQRAPSAAQLLAFTTSLGFTLEICTEHHPPRLLPSGYEPDVRCLRFALALAEFAVRKAYATRVSHLLPPVTPARRWSGSTRI